MALTTFTITNDGQFLVVTSSLGAEESINLASIKDISCINVIAFPGTYPYVDMNLVTVEINNRETNLTFDLAAVTNQATWTLNQVGCNQAQTDIRGWLVTASGGAGLATEATLSSLLSELQKGKDYEVKLVKDTGAGNLIVKEVVLWNQTSGTFDAPIYYDAAGSVYVPVGAILYVDTEAAIIALLNEVANSVQRTPSFTNVLGVANTSVAAGARSVAFFNNGPTVATILGSPLAAGKGIEFPAGGENDTLAAITYVTIATGDLDITTIV